MGENGREGQFRVKINFGGGLKVKRIFKKKGSSMIIFLFFLLYFDLLFSTQIFSMSSYNILVFFLFPSFFSFFSFSKDNGWLRRRVVMLLDPDI